MDKPKYVIPTMKEIKQTIGSNGYSLVSTFSGCGGACLGFEMAGFKTLYANEFIEEARNTYALNHPGVFIDGRDIRNVTGSDILKTINLKSGELDVLEGSPPCSSFSMAGKRDKKWGEVSDYSDDQNQVTDDLFFEYVRVLKDLQPKVFVAENVKGLVSLGNVKDTIQRDFAKIGKAGYLVVEPRILKAHEYGVPQTRERVIFIGFRRDLLVPEAEKELSRKSISAEYDPYPTPTHGASAAGHRRYVTVKEALVGLPEPSKSKDLSQQTYSKGRWDGSHCQGNKEVDLDMPGPTIRAEHHGNIEFRRLEKQHGGSIERELNKGLQERRLTVRECARIQTFPDDYSLVRLGSKKEGSFGLSGSDGGSIS